ncbi:hypothetical protein LSUE1_G002429 [Lachnellula suecica]|uniref:Uncharacterized protein n=1 Tax=Lachnellula suecica TaxID=602035 RepID=A0A8T9CEP6_9HELO|nr:hypothetical protein LSUE1_G002429 [Lachnellula suecica]
MYQARLNDAAIVLYRVLERAGVNFGIFGGYAIAALGGPRESKDIDCVASVTKAQIIALLDAKDGFAAVPQGRQDYVAFLWSNTPNRKNAVLVEIFCEQFPGSQHSMRNLQATAVGVSGEVMGNGTSLVLDPFHLFKGKLRAAATRDKFHDSADLRWLESRFSQQIRARSAELKPVYAGLAMKRYPELEILLAPVGINVNAAKHAARNLDPNHLPSPAPGDVQEGLLG